ncbi:hypothetical protein D0C36_17305 [Mucilaginibacter conchicola]|uniref:Uncharacterized protein n=2 Tax=Mucilaginibacter conchicola TaxID=2303333 RepID=A0A372NPC8_9SPHI|nr:hypothetical protein D0C36_17305 [Mucilaginibacter conchicola]
MNGLLPTGDALVFEARLILNPALQEEVLLHKQTLALVKQYGREALRKDIEDIHQQLFSHPQHRSFKDSILRFFKH